MLYLDVCCNDPDNGAFTGRAVALSIGAAEFEANDIFTGSAFREDGYRIILSGKAWHCEWSKDWVGNWCWNRYQIGIKGRTVRWYLVDFVIWLRRRRLFNLTTAPTEFFDWWKSGDDIAPAKLHEMVCDLEHGR